MIRKRPTDRDFNRTPMNTNACQNCYGVTTVYSNGRRRPCPTCHGTGKKR